MAYCDVCGNFDDSHRESMEYPKDSQHCIQDYQPDLYYYWDAPLEEIYYWRDAFPKVDCMCEICFDIANEEKKIIWADHQCANYISVTRPIAWVFFYVIMKYTNKGFMFTIETFPATVQQTTDSERKALDICESMAYVYGFARVVDYDGNTIKEVF